MMRSAGIVGTFVGWVIAHPRRYKLMVSDTVISDKSGMSVRAAESAFERVEVAILSG
ncbi:hypothetical protein [Leifsonia sp. AG29]|uniref:hypothetical protein n=1 Tax=Leifsonia sp. AG29 TaxID=2598860 RepID=UPI0018EEF7AB|nr:hypothetical protein [Leifsonia sp. AG29]